jgi:hypothetical protein
MNTPIIITRLAGYVKLQATGNITFQDLLNACEDNDFSLDSYITGHLMLIDDREEMTYMLNDHYVDVIDVLNECGNFTAKLSILDYSEFQY